ncbi:unnamed protein product [Didymodactylos carnosus]|uniref:DNA mismatch repair protein Mlh1 C-terminal domain-containing protein n=1 Tax=Didymodactylos carnosus TaxID=1234261 RepID=A0A815DC92_9BILA|nr:unnamed protein product [Didymodactylos carnosus]CAF4110656.1 unnamed protein product [Didymodactylos carnosus]
MMSSNKIRKLDETLINRIAAGEVVVRPCSAIKELIENSLDASSHQIHVYVKHGGLKRTEIRDDDCEILKDDLPLLCEHSAASKLSSVDDFYQLNTYGFRVEALASLSYASHLTVITKVKHSPCAYTCTYEDGKIKNQVKPCAETFNHQPDTNISSDDIVAYCLEFFSEKSEMLADYYSLSVSSDGRLETLPLLLENYVPNLD